MEMQKMLLMVGFTTFMASFTGSAQATLFDRGGGLLYDDVLNVTWLQDANYAKSSGYSADGVFRGSQAVNWAANLTYYDNVRNVNYDDWRLPTVSPVDLVWNFNFSYDGSTDWGPNNLSPRNELSYMYFVNLGLSSFLSKDGLSNANFGIYGDGTQVGQNDISTAFATVKNLQAASYWTGTEWMPGGADYLFTFVTSLGETSAAYEYTAQYAWAVRDGDVLTVPEPNTLPLMLAGLGVVGWMARRRFAESLVSREATVTKQI